MILKDGIEKSMIFFLQNSTVDVWSGNRLNQEEPDIRIANKGEDRRIGIFVRNKDFITVDKKFKDGLKYH